MTSQLRFRLTHLRAKMLAPSQRADLYLDDEKFARARACYDKAIGGSRTDQPDPIYRRGIADIHLGDFEAAVPDLEYVTSRDPKYDSHRAIALLAHA